MLSYEQILERISAIPKGIEGHDRTIYWLTTAEVVGAARDHLGHIELFLAGPELQPKIKTVRKAIQYHSWHRANGAGLSATRLLFPAYGHFDQVAALIATELLREQADHDLPRAFAVTEPIIELAIKRLELSEATLLGLAGELLLLDAISRRIDDQYVGQLIEAWHGWRRSARDLVWNGTGIEVKTTTRDSSSHIVQGTHQVEPFLGDDITPKEEGLLLVSIGLQYSEPSPNAFTVPQLTQRVVDRLKTTGGDALVDSFLSHVEEYGSESGIGYRHPAMSHDAPFTMGFTPAFVRGYDMGDTAVQVLRRDDVVSHHHVDPGSLSFRIDLPALIGPNNPVDGLFRVANNILGNKQ